MNRQHLRPRITQPAGKVELDAETRQLLADAIAAHDDDNVTLEEYGPIVMRLHHHIQALTEAERLEVAGQLFAATIGGRYVGWGTV